MKRILAATFFISYIVVLGLWPTSRWWMSPSFMTWSMYSRGNADGADDLLVEATFKDGRRLVLPTAPQKPFYYIYPPGTQIPPRDSLSENALFRFTEHIRALERLVDQICIALPEAKVIHYREKNAEESSLPCRR